MYVPVGGESHLEFVVHFFQRTFGKHLLGLASPGGAGRNKTLGQIEFDKLKVLVPEHREQKKIADFLDALDTKIRQFEQKRELLEQYKRGVMQQIFTQKIRFKDKNGKPFPKWEKRKLGEISSPPQYGLNTAAIEYDGISKYIFCLSVPRSARSQMN